MKKAILIWLLTVILVVMSCSPVPDTADSFGNVGTLDESWVEIWNWNDLDAIRDDLSGSYVLMTDLDSTTAGYDYLAGPHANDGKGWEPIGASGSLFTGTFDGQFNDIQNLFIDRTDDDYVGLFGYVGGATIERIILTDIDVSGRLYVGGLAGAASRGTVTDSHSSGSVTGFSRVGGLVGRLTGHSGDRGRVDNSSSSASIAGNRYVGGLVGATSSYGRVSLSSATGAVSGDSDVGGLVGYNARYGGVGSSFASSTVSGHQYVGGLVGTSFSSVANSYATGNVVGVSQVGGLIGRNSRGVTNCHATGSVSGDESVGGLIGFNVWGYFERGAVRDSYATGSVEGAMYIGGLVGYNDRGSTVRNSHYDYDKVLINGGKIITVGALSGEDFEEWLANDRFLDIDQRLLKEAEYYVIDTVDDFRQMLAFGQEPALKFRLQNDLDLAGDPNLFIPYLAGEFYGNGYTIANFSFVFDFISQVGLFGIVASGGSVSGVGADNVDVTGHEHVGGVVGYNYGGTVINSYSTGSVTGVREVGGLVGFHRDGTVRESYYDGSVGGTNRVGGLVGFSDASTVRDSWAAGSVSGSNAVGGLVGLSRGSVNRSYSTADVTGDQVVGGLVGSMRDRTISDSYATGNVSGNGHVGGLVGWMADASVHRSYAIGTVTGTVSVGGLIGERSYSSVSNSFWDWQTTGRTTSAGGTGKTTVEMMGISTYADTDTEGLSTPWDITAVAHGETDLDYTWNVVDGQTYPFLSWRPILGDAPVARASDISGQKDVMHPDEPYTITAKYFDPDGREDLKYCYLQLLHPDKPLTMMWNQATDGFWTYEGEEGEDYLTVTGSSTPITEGGLQGYQLAWTFTIKDTWPEVENAIDFGVYAWDDSNLKSGWDHDDTKASFLLSAPEVGHVILIEPLSIRPGDPHFVGDALAASFSVQNVGDAAITLDKLLVRGTYYGSELPGGGLPDFTYEAVTLLPGDTHDYEGHVDVTEVGKYDFYIAYYIDNPTEAEKQYLDEHNWNTSIDLRPGLTDDDRTWQVVALAPPIPNIAYIPVRFLGEEPPVDIRWLRETAQLVRQYYYQQSYGEELLSHAFVFDEWQELPKTRDEYPDSKGWKQWKRFDEPQHSIIRDAMAIAQNSPGFDPDQYDVVVVIQTDELLTAQAIEGRAIVRARSPRGVAYGVWAHELGHALPGLRWKDYYGGWWFEGHNGHINFWGLMGEGHTTNPPAPIMSYHKVMAGWLQHETVSYGTHEVNLLQDLESGDGVLLWPGLFTTFIIEGRHPPDGVAVDEREAPNRVLIPTDGILLYKVDYRGRVYNISQSDESANMITLTEGDSYTSDWNLVRFTANKEGSQWKITISPFTPLERVIVSMIGLTTVLWETGAQRSAGLSENPFDIDLHVYTQDGRKVGMDYDTGTYVLEIDNARASGNILGGGPEWISVPDQEDVYFVVDPTPARKWAEENDIEDLEIGVEVQVIFYDDEGESTHTEPLALSVSLDRSVYCVATATGTGIAGLTTSHGTVQDLEALTVPADLPEGYAFPHGLFSFEVTDLDYDGQTVTVTIDLPTPVPAGTKWWKYHDGQWHDYDIPIMIDGSTITIDLTDGGVGDIDGIVDGIITDPGGPGNPAPPPPPVTVGWEGSSVDKAAVVAPWIALLAAIAGASLLVLRRRKTQI